MGEIRSISRSHVMSIAREPLNPRGRECLACAAVFLAKSDFRLFLSDLTHSKGPRVSARGEGEMS